MTTVSSVRSKWIRGRNLVSRFVYTWKTDSAGAAFRRASGAAARMRRRAERFDEVDLIFDLLSHRRNAVMVDVGAHHGNSFSPFLLSGWRVLAFEPDSKNRAELEAGYGRGNDRLEVSPLAVHSEDGLILDFYNSEISTGISGLSAFDESHAVAYQVETVTLRTFLGARGIEEVDFLKIDAEGFDLTVLSGFDWTGTPPSAVVVEFEDAKTIPLGHTWTALASFLAERSYSVLVSEWSPIDGYGGQHQWKSIAAWPCALADPEGWGNLIAFQDPVLARRYLVEASACGS